MLKYFEIAVWAIGLAFSLAIIVPFIDDGLPLGWDLLPHAYLTERMAGYLRARQISGYNPYWFAGYPEFSLYPPLYYIVAVLPSLVSNGAISVLLSFGLINAAVTLLVPLGFRAVATSWWGASAGSFGVFCGFAFLFSGTSSASAGVGIHSLWATGLAPNLFAFLLLLFMVAALGPPWRTMGRPALFITAITLGAVCSSHLLTGLFALGYLTIYLASSSQRLPLLGAMFFGCVSTLWWSPEFFTHLRYSAGRAIGLPSPYFDPLEGLFSGINFEWLATMLASHGAGTLEFGGGNFVTTLSVNLLQTPLLGILCAFGAVAGIRAEMGEKRWLLPLLFVASLLVLPRNLYAHFADSGIHFYRFTQQIWIFSALLIVRGIMAGKARLDMSSTPFKSLTVSLCGSLIMLVALATAGWSDLPHEDKIRRSISGTPSNAILAGKSGAILERAPLYASVMEFSKAVALASAGGRVAVETSLGLYDSFRSPHLFTTLLPERFGIEVIPGLLAESSISAPFLTPLLGKDSDHLIWGGRPSISIEELWRFPMEALVDRLRLYGVRIVIASSARYRDALRKSSGLRSVVSTDFAEAFSIESTEPVVAPMAKPPYLFVETGGPSFEAFAREAYANEVLYRMPIVSAAGDSPVIAADGPELSGVIISNGPGLALSDETRRLLDLLRAARPLLRVAVLLGLDGAGRYAGSPTTFIPEGLYPEGLRNLPIALDFHASDSLSARISPSIELVITEAVPPNFERRLSSKGDLHLPSAGWWAIRYSFAPRFEVEPIGKVFKMSPTLMALHTKGPCTLRYR